MLFQKYVRHSGVAFIAFLLILACPSYAEEIRDYYSEPGLNPFKSAVNQSLNEYIDPFSGVLQLKHTDVYIPGNGGMDINISRVYTSLQRSQYPTRNINGFGWTMHFGRIVVPVGQESKICSQGTYNATTADNPSVEWPDGGRELLVLSSELNDGTLITRSNAKAVCNPGGGLIVTTADGISYTMDKINLVEGVTSWLTSSMVDLHGNRIIVEYDSTLGVTYPVAIYRSEEGDSVGVDTPVVEFEYSGLTGTDPYAILLDQVKANGETWDYNYEAIQSGYVYPVYQLTEVVRPDNKSWEYRYNGSEPDPDPADGVIDVGPGSFSLSGLTYPNGADIDYTYQYVQFDPHLARRSTSIHTKNVSGGDIENGAWTYEFAPSSLPVDVEIEGSGVTKELNLDVTTVTSPQNVIVFNHYGAFRLAELDGSNVLNYFWSPRDIGLLRNQKTYSLNGDLLEFRQNNWGERLISYENYFHGEAGLNSIYQSTETYAPVLLSEYVTRDSSTATQNFNNVTTYEAHDAFGNPQRIIESNPIAEEFNRITDYTYKNDLNLWLLGLPETEVISEGGRGTGETTIGTISRTYFASGQLKDEDRFGVVTSYTYHPEGDVASITDASLKAKSFDDYKRGIAQIENWPEGITITRVVNNTGTVQSETNGRGKTTSYTYDGLNRLKSIDFPQGDSVSVSYTANHRTLSRGVFQQIDYYDQLGREIQVDHIDTASNETITTTYAYDQLSRKTFISQPGDTRGTDYEFDALGRVLKEDHFDGTFVSYLYDGLNLTVTDQLAKATTYNYRQYGSDYGSRSISAISQPDSVVTKITRNTLGMVTTIFQGELTGSTIYGHAREFTYDNKFFLETEKHPEITQLNSVSQLISYGRDAVGNMTSKTVGDSNTVSYLYDDLHRLKTIDYATSDDVNYTYTLTGKIKTVNNSTAQKTYIYDDNDNLTDENVVIEGVSYPIHYAINSLDAVSSINYPSGRSVDYSPDAFGRPTQAMPYATNVSYHPSGQIQSMTYANGQVTTINLTDRLWLDSIHVAGNQTVVDLQYLYGATGNVDSITNRLNGSNNKSFTYDDLHRLKTANGSWGNSSYDYDHLGNITTGDKGANHYSGQLLTAINDPQTAHIDINFEYDLRGNISADDRRRVELIGQNLLTLGNRYEYSYSDGDELLSASRYSGDNYVDQINYLYDGDKNRVKRERGIDVDHYLYSTQGLLLSEFVFGQDISTAKDYFYLGRQQIAAVKENELPVADAGEDLSVSFLQEVILDGSKSGDSDGSIVSYTWTQVSGTGVTLLNASSATPNFFVSHLLATEDLTFNLQVTDSSGEFSLIDSVVVNVLVDSSSDVDGDYLPDLFELANGFDPLDPEDGALDGDGDGVVNWQEYLAGTDLKDSQSFPASGSLLWSAGNTTAGYNVSSPTISGDGTVYIGSSYLYAYTPSGEEKWRFRAGNPFGSAPAIDADGTIYAGSYDDYFYAINPDGSQKWKFKAQAQISASAAIGSQGEVYVGSWDNNFYSFNSDGTLRWSYLTGADVRSSAAISPEGTIYVGSGDRYLYAFNPDGSVKWKFYTDGSITSSPAIGRQGEVYISSDNSLYSIDPTGVLRWKYKGINSNISPILGPDGEIYIYQISSILVLNTDGSLQWESEDLGSAPIWSSPALDSNGILYIGFSNGEFIAVSNNGLVAWRYQAGDRIESSPAISDSGVIYFSAGENNLTALVGGGSGLAKSPWPKFGGDKYLSGNQCSQMVDVLGDTDSDGIPNCYEYINGLDLNSAADADQDLDADGLTNVEEFVLGTALRRLDTDMDNITDYDEAVVHHTNPLSKDTDGDALPDEFELLNNFDPLNSADGSFDSDGDGFVNWKEYLLNFDIGDVNSMPGQGQSLWEFSSGNRSQTNDTGASLSIGLDGAVYISSVSTGKLSALDIHGNLKWERPSSTSTPVIGADGTIFTTNYQNLDAINPDGSLRWSYNVGAGIISPAIGGDGTVFVVSGNGNYLYAINPDGTFKWSYQAGGPLGGAAPTIGGDGTVYIGSYDNYLYAINADGSAKWTYDAGYQVLNSSSIGSDGTIYIAVNDHLHAINPDGIEKWKYHNQSGYRITTKTAVIDNTNTIYFGAGDGSFNAINPDGSFKWSFDTGRAIYSSAAIGSDGIIYFGSDNQTFYALNQDGELQWSRSFSGIGNGNSYEVNSAITLDGDGTIYFMLDRGDVHALINTGGGLANSYWPKHGRDIGSTSSAISFSNNNAPVLSISTPLDNSVISFGDIIALIGTGIDDEDGDLSGSIVWNSSIDGQLGTGSSVSVDLTEAVHNITATVSDSGGATSIDSISITVTSDDVDSDGLPNAWELANGLDPYSPADAALDADGDGLSNLEEFTNGSNPNDVAPTLSISSPSDGTSFMVGNSINLIAIASDSEDGDLTSSINWSSNIDGSLGNGGSIDVALTQGIHTITATVADSAGGVVSDVLSLTMVVNIAPAVTISSPLNAAIVNEGVFVSLEAAANDVEDGDLTSAIQWVSDIDGPLGVGTNLSVLLSQGPHTLTASVEDSNLISGSASVVLTINAAPVVAITQPLDSVTIDVTEAVTLTATATDTEEGDLTSGLTWSSSIDGALGTGNNLVANLTVGSHVLTATVTDSQSASGSHSVNLTVTAATADTDTDADGMPDSWETTYGLNIADAADRNADPDADGHANYLEFVAGTNPQDNQSVPLTRYTVLNPIQVGKALNVVSLVDANTITAGATVLNLNANELATIPAQEVAQGLLIEGTGGFSIGSAVNSTDMPVANSFVGYDFVIPHLRNSHLYYVLSNTGDASIEVNDGASTSTVTAVQGQVLEIVAGSTNGIAATLRSDLPIMVMHGGSSATAPNRDVYPVPPASRDLLGTKRKAHVGALDDGTIVSVYTNGGLTEQLNLSANQIAAVGVGNNATEGDNDVIHLVANKPIAAVEYADGDGSETTAYFDTVYMANHYGLPVDSQYIVAACLQTGEITLTDGVNLAQTQTCTSDGQIPGRVHFGSSTDGVNINAGAIVDGDVPFYLMYEASATNDEHNLLGAMRIAPINTAPLVTIQSPTTASWFNEGDMVSFSATALDAEDGELSALVQWQSDISGLLGTGVNLLTDLTPSAHTITALATDSSNKVGSNSVVVNVNALPQLVINPPLPGQQVDAGMNVTLSGLATDAEDGDLSAAINWQSDLDGALGVGNNLVINSLTLGSHNILAYVSDSRSATATDTVSLIINPPVGGGYVDSDGDGMSDTWEDANGLDKNDPADRLADSDGDGIANYLEYQGNSDPTDSQSMPLTQHYVLNPLQAGKALNVVSLVDGNIITAGATVLNLNANELGVIPAQDVSQGMLVEGSGAFSIGSAVNSTDMPLSQAFAGRDFVIPHQRNSHIYYLLSLTGDASIDVNDGATTNTVTATQGQVLTVQAGATNGIAASIRSDLPILVLHAGTNSTAANRDVYPVPPVSFELLGSRRRAYVGALEDGTTISVYSNGGLTEQITLNANERGAISIGDNSTEGASDVVHLVANKPIAAVQYADGDGSETTAFIDPVYFGQHYGVPVDSQYIVASCLANGDVTLTDGANTPVTQSCTSDGQIPGRVYFGSTTDGVNMGAGSIVESTVPIYLMYETSATNDEHNVLGR